MGVGLVEMPPFRGGGLCMSLSGRVWSRVRVAVVGMCNPQLVSRVWLGGPWRGRGCPLGLGSLVPAHGGALRGIGVFIAML